MAVSTTFPGVVPTAAEARPAAAAPSPAARPGMLARCGDWLRRRRDAACLRGMEPRLARDIGVAPACADLPDGFAVDPRPLWGVGLTPQPFDAAPPRSPRRGG